MSKIAVVTDLADDSGDWTPCSLGELFKFKNGLNKAKQYFGAGTPIVNYMDVYSSPHIRANDIAGRVTVTPTERKNFSARKGDVFFTRTSETVEEIGMASVALDDLANAVFSGFVLRARQMSKTLDSLFTGYALRSEPVRRQIGATASYTTRALTNGRLLSAVRLSVPPVREQKAIAAALSDADALIEGLESLIAKKRAIQQGAMQELLTGKRRLPGFTGKWDEKRIADVAIPSTKKNILGDNLPVLTCSKHLGFVDSLEYFKNQVFSRDTSGYKIIRRDEIGYPANHIEEGSIGLQDLYDTAIVSPIYIVFSVKNDVSSYFLHRKLKLDEYRHKFQVATSASVDRRGSLRWPVFSQIWVSLPSYSEQVAISQVSSDMDAQVAALEGRLLNARKIKQGMMQELLTGRIRLV